MTRTGAVLGLLGLAVLLAGAGHDNNVEWSGVSHIAWLDRAPLCPINGESFVVSFQTYHYDITSAQVYVTAGSSSWVAAGYSHTSGPYDIWTATVPASAPTGQLSYWIALTDGTLTDYLSPSGMSHTVPGSGWVLDFATLGHAPLGGTLTSDGGAAFKVWAANATTANVAGQFNGWSSTTLPMTKSGAYFTRKVAAPVSANQQYKYVFNGSTWKTDARGRAQNPSDNDNTYIVNPDAYTWGDQSYSTGAFEDMVIYELHVGTFSGYNDGLNRMGRFRDVVDTHLDHLLYLGVTAVELMPPTEFDYYESWGYNPVNNWAPENAYGSPADFKYMIDTLHQNGIAVLMDVCFNHFSNSGNFLWNYDSTQIYFDNPAVQTPWGSQAAFWKQEVKDYFADAILHWLDEYHIDGFRMDATRYMRDNYIFPGGQSSGWSLMQYINNNIDNRKVQAISIAEELPNEPMITTATGSGGAGFDAQWHMAFRDAVRQATFDAAYGNPNMSAVAGAINDATYPSKTTCVRYIESHDEAGNGDRLPVTIDSGDHYSVWVKGRGKLAQGLTILAPGIPMFLQGGEWLEDIKFGSSVGNRIDWSKAVGRAGITQFFHDLIAIRKENCGFRSNAGFQVHHVDDTNNVIAFHRWCDNGNDLIIVASFNNSDLYNYTIGFAQTGTWYEILNSQASAYLGNNVGNGGSVVANGGSYDGLPTSASITIPQMGLLVFRYNVPPPIRGDTNCDGIISYGDINPFVIALQGQSVYEAAYPNCRWLNADTNGDGTVNYGDINPFVVCLTQGGCP